MVKGFNSENTNFLEYLTNDPEFVRQQDINAFAARVKKGLLAKFRLDDSLIAQMAEKFRSVKKNSLTPEDIKYALTCLFEDENAKLNQQQRNKINLINQKNTATYLILSNWNNRHSKISLLYIKNYFLRLQKFLDDIQIRNNQSNPNSINRLNQYYKLTIQPVLEKKSGIYSLKKGQTLKESLKDYLFNQTLTTADLVESLKRDRSLIINKFEHSKFSQIFHDCHDHILALYLMNWNFDNQPSVLSKHTDFLASLNNNIQNNIFSRESERVAGIFYEIRKTLKFFNFSVNKEGSGSKILVQKTNNQENLQDYPLPIFNIEDYKNSLTDEQKLYLLKIQNQNPDQVEFINSVFSGLYLESNVHKYKLGMPILFENGKAKKDQQNRYERLDFFNPNYISFIFDCCKLYVEEQPIFIKGLQNAHRLTNIFIENNLNGLRENFDQNPNGFSSIFITIGDMLNSEVNEIYSNQFSKEYMSKFAYKF